MYVLPHSAQGHILSGKGAEKPKLRVLWSIWNIDFTLTVDLPMIHGQTSADVRGKGFHQLPHARAQMYIHTGGLIMHTHRIKRFLLMDSPLPWRKYNSKSMRWRAEGGTVKPSRGTHPWRGLPTRFDRSYMSTAVPMSTRNVSEAPCLNRKMTFTKSLAKKIMILTL